MRYSVAIIGAGNIASRFDLPTTNKVLTHAHAVLQHEHYKLLGFYDIDYKKALEAADRWGTKAFSDMDKLVNAADVCVCCVPDKYHASAISQISKHNPLIIITEKPIADNYSDAIQLYENSLNKRSVAVNYSRRFIPEFQTLKKSMTQFGSLVKGVAYYGKGILHNGSHLVDLFRFFFGEIDYAKQLGKKLNDYEDDTTFDAILSWGNSSIYLIGVDSRQVTVFETDLMFERGRIRLLDGGQKIEIYEKKESIDYKGYYGYSLSKTIDIDYSDALVGLYDNIYNYLHGKEELLCDLSDGLRAIEVCEMIRSNE